MQYRNIHSLSTLSRELETADSDCGTWLKNGWNHDQSDGDVPSDNNSHCLTAEWYCQSVFIVMPRSEVTWNTGTTHLMSSWVSVIPIYGMREQYSTHQTTKCDDWTRWKIHKTFIIGTRCIQIENTFKFHSNWWLLNYSVHLGILTIHDSWIISSSFLITLNNHSTNSVNSKILVWHK